MSLALDRMRELWEGSPELSAREIGSMFGVSKGSVIGLADRHQWATRNGKPRKERPAKPAKAPRPTRPAGQRRVHRSIQEQREPSTIFTRLAALHASLDAVLAETRPHVEDRAKVLVAADARRAAG